MRIFVTGASGFVGQRLCARLLDSGHELTLLRHTSKPGTDRHARVHEIRADMADAQTLDGKLGGHDAVVHLAGAVGYGQDRGTCRRLNVIGTENMATHAAKAGIQHFVHMSSVAVYGRIADVKLPESFPCKAIGDPYGDTKIAAEDALRRVCAASSMRFTILRPTVIYGPGDDKFMPKVVENLRAKVRRIIGSGEQTVDLIHVDDVVDFMALTLQRPPEPRDAADKGRIFNLNNAHNPSWRSFLALVAGHLGLEPPVATLPYPAALAYAALLELASEFSGRPPRLTRYAVRVVGRQYHYCIDAARAFGLRQRVSLESGIAGCLVGDAAAACGLSKSTTFL